MSKVKGVFKKAPANPITTASKTAADAAALKALQAGLPGGQAAAATKLVSGFGGFSSLQNYFTNTVKPFFASVWAWIQMNSTLVIVITVVLALLIFFSLDRYYNWGYFRFGGEEAATKEQTQKAETTANVLNSATAAATKEGFADMTAPTTAPEDINLLNVQPLSIKQAGFLGPLPQGEFQPDTATANALRAGFRSFVLQIDYLTVQKAKDKFADPKVPTLLYKGDDGALLSTNSGDIESVSKTITNLAFRPEVPNNSMPVLLYLHILRTPSPIREPQEHLRFLSRIARGLNPLAPKHLGVTPFGGFNRQKQEPNLLTTPLKSLEGQVVILSNVDTTLFRVSSKDGTRYDPADDLDFWVNMRVYLDSDEDTIGVTKVPDDKKTPSAVVVRLSDLLALPPSKQEAFATRGKGRFVIALPSQMKNPTPEELDTALNKLGVNMVPLDIFSDDVKEVKKLVDEYDSKSYRAKAAALQNH